MYVPHYFKMNSDTDVLLMDSRGLQNGMVVLAASDGGRTQIDTYTNQPKIYPGGDQEAPFQQARKYNRWCTITQLRTDDKGYRFVGVYAEEDGYSFIHEGGIESPWYAKKDSILEIYTPDEYSIGFQAGKTAGIAQGLEESKKQYNQGFVDGAKGVSFSSRQPMLKEQYLASEEKTWPPAKNPVFGKDGKLSTDPKILSEISKHREDHPSLKPFSLMFENDNGEVERFPIDEAVEEEQSGTVIRDVAKTVRESDTELQ